MARFIHMAAIMLASVSCLSGLGSAASVPNDPNAFARVKQPDCDCKNTFYFKSQNAAPFSTGEKDCRNLFKEDAHLVYLGKPQEIANLTQFLDNDDSGTFYWTGGEYNAENERFEWGNGDPFDESGWAPGHHPPRNSMTKIVVTHIPRKGLRFSTDQATESYRYICVYYD